MTRVPGIRDRLSLEPVIRLETARGPHLVRIVGGRPVVHQILCPHRGASLADANVVGDLVICTWHRSTFRCADGRRMHGPADRGIRVIPAHFDRADLIIEWPAGPDASNES
jgi:nitrite reductase/ring-hydroxylating ferredoxin subunit